MSKSKEPDTGPSGTRGNLATMEQMPLLRGECKGDLMLSTMSTLTMQIIQRQEHQRGGMKTSRSCLGRSFSADVANIRDMPRHRLFGKAHWFVTPKFFLISQVVALSYTNTLIAILSTPSALARRKCICLRSKKRLASQRVLDWHISTKMSNGTNSIHSAT